MVEIAMHKVIEKIDTLGPMGRYSLVLRKEGCPIGCAEWMPVSKAFWDHCQPYDLVEVRLSRV